MGVGDCHQLNGRYLRLAAVDKDVLSVRAVGSYYSARPPELRGNAPHRGGLIGHLRSQDPCDVPPSGSRLQEHELPPGPASLCKYLTSSTSHRITIYGPIEHRSRRSFPPSYTPRPAIYSLLNRVYHASAAAYSV